MHTVSTATAMLVVWVLFEAGSYDVRGVCEPGESNYTTTVTNTKNVTVYEMKTKIVKTRTRAWWSWKTTYRTEMYIDMEEKMLQNKTTVEQCCPGYSETNLSSGICTLTGCLNDGTYGDSCTLACSCPDNAFEICDKESGNCTCMPGWHGTNCTKVCETGRYGVDCQSTCECENLATCDPRTGKCTCPTGWEGYFCEKACRNGTYGDRCNKTCGCTLYQMCDHVTGNCDTCKPGVSNPPACNKNCTDWSFGQNCTRNCSCDTKNTESCHWLTGKCNCKLGYNGSYCQHECPPHTYGYQCSKSCEDENCTYGFCNHVNGSCYSCYGKTGPNCTEECQTYKFGFDCLSQCRCSSSHSNGTCDSCSGACHCHKGWTGYTCDIECPAHMVDTQCQSVMFGNSCEPENLTWLCSDGWTGKYCDKVCDVGRYGNNCSSSCTCNINQECNYVTGHCTCKSGYTGDDCSAVCDVGRYGRNCSSFCKCNSNQECNHVTGQCTCKSGYTDNDCVAALTAGEDGGAVGQFVYILPAVGAVLLAACVLAVVVCIWRRKRRELNKELTSNSNAVLATRDTEQYTMNVYGASTSKTSDHPYEEDKHYADVDSEENNAVKLLPINKLSTVNGQNSEYDTSEKLVKISTATDNTYDKCESLTSQEGEYDVIAKPGVVPKALTSNEKYCTFEDVRQPNIKGDTVNKDENPVSDSYDNLDYRNEKDRCLNFDTSLYNVGTEFSISDN